MNKPHIEFLIEPDGQVKIEAHGFSGQDCLKATKNYEQALGLVGQRKMKAVKTEKVKVKA